MNRNMREKRSAWIMVDETDSERDDNSFSIVEDHSDYKDGYRSSKALVKDKVRDNKIDLTKTRKKREEIPLKTKPKSVMEFVIITDDEDDKDINMEINDPVTNKKRKGSNFKVPVKRVRTIQGSSPEEKFGVDEQSVRYCETKSENKRLNNEGNSDSDSVVEFYSNQKTDRNYKDKVPALGAQKLKRKTSNKDIEASSSTAAVEVKKKRLGRKVDEWKGERSKEMAVQNNKDIKLETELPVTNIKRKKSNEKVARNRIKTVKASSLKPKSENDEEDKDLFTVKSENYELQKNESNAKGDIDWSESDYLVEFNQVEPQVAKNIISLFKNDNTIPFIARYRKEMTGGMEPEQLRSIKNAYDNIKSIKQRALGIVKSIDKLGKWSPEIHSAVSSAKTMQELDLIYAQFKPGAKGSLAERAKALGLVPISEAILQGQAIPNLCSLIDMRKDGLKNENDVRQGVVHIIADKISKDKTTFEGIHKLRKTTVIKIETTKSKSADSLKVKKDGKRNNDHQKYERYFNFASSEKLIKGYQILAINRGESQKILSVKIIVPEWWQTNLKDHCLKKYNFVMRITNFYRQILEDSFDDAYNRLIKPFILRQVRHDLNQRAESAAIEVFASNLKKLLLTPPLRGETILGIDPGFTHGCKLAVISHCGNVLDTTTIYLNTSSRFKKEQEAQVLVNLVKKHNCTIFALGNATACRETEMFLTELIQAGGFAPLDISYTIVNEAGASVYSCGSEAKAEFPDLDPNIISAISIARRLQDPLAELIKVEPQHLGIGMYQHDLPKKQLQLTLDEVITETVSFVGVDINTASHCLLRKVAGLSTTRATSIIAWRNENGPFCNRQQLLEVKGIGKKIFEQCAGFIRILPETALTGKRPRSEKYSLDYLDQTWIHPESYDVARKFLKVCGCDPNHLGTDNFIRKISSYATGSLENLAKQFGTSETSMDIIINGLSMKKGEDIRVKEEAPLFQKNFRCMDDLSPNTRVTGLVRNVTDFGIFVDIGVEKSGLIPIGKLKGQTLGLGQRVEVLVLSIDKNRGRISLSL